MKPAPLSGVEAGVIRVDKNLKMTIANASAQSLLDFIYRPGTPTELGQVAQVHDGGAPVD